jgi:hypothetical protein
MYTWTCSVISMMDSSNDKGLSSDVLAVTWQWSHSIDPSGFTTRTVSGKLLLDSAVVAGGTGADFFRNVITQAIPVTLYFKRESMEFTQSEDGRVLSFSVVDVETEYTLPPPITAGHASFMSRVHGYGEAGALNVDYNLSGWFESSAAHGKNEIIAAIVALMLAKFSTVGSNVIFTERVMREDIYGRNRIDFSISAIQPAGALAQGNDTSGTASNIDFNAGLQTFGIQPPGSNGVALFINPYGQTEGLGSGAWAFAPSLYDADPSSNVTSSGGYNFNMSQQPPTVGPPGTFGGEPPTTGDQSQPVIDGISDLHGTAPFIAFHEVISYEYDNHLVQLVPKLATAMPVIQQAGVPSLITIQAGYSKQVAKSITDIKAFGNPPAFPVSLYNVQSSYVSTPNVEPIGDGVYNIYSCEWRYVFLKNAQPTADDTQFVPFDPRRPNAATNPTVNSQQLPFGNSNPYSESPAPGSILQLPQT